MIPPPAPLSTNPEAAVPLNPVTDFLRDVVSVSYVDAAGQAQTIDIAERREPSRDA